MSNRKIAPKPKRSKKPSPAAITPLLALRRKLIDVQHQLDELPARFLMVLVQPVDLEDFEMLADSIIGARSDLALAFEEIDSLENRGIGPGGVS